MNRATNNRKGFTLVELLVVISILLVLSTLVVVAFNGRNSDKTRSAARIAQSAFLGAKDRALHAKDLRGIRLTRDLTNTNLINGFAYLQPLPLQTTGNIPGQPQLQNVTVTRPNYPTNTNATEVIITGSTATTWHQQDASGLWSVSPLKVRIPASTGQWYTLAQQSTSAPYYWTTDANGFLNITLQTPYLGGTPGQANAIDPTSQNASIDIQLGNDVLPFHQPITLSSGVIIDLANSSPNVQSLAGIGAGSNPNVDVMFSPRGSVSGFVGGLGPLHFLMRSLKDATAGANPWAVGGPATANPDQSRDDRLILSVFPQTGLVQVFEIDTTDNFANPTTNTPVSLPGTGSPDGIADDLFALARKGKSAGH